MNKMYAKTNHPKYTEIYPVVEILGTIIALKINGLTTDFGIKEIEKFCNQDGTNYRHKFE